MEKDDEDIQQNDKVLLQIKYQCYYKSNISAQERNRNNGFQSEHCRFSKEIGERWYGNRVVDEWNELASEVMDAITSGGYKHMPGEYMTDAGWV